MAQVLKENVRRQILRSAREVLIKKGYKGCTMREIADGTNITVGNLYRYFNSKTAIYDEIVNTIIDKVDAVMLSESGGVVSLKSNNQVLPEYPQMTFKRIEEGIIKLVPILVKNYKKEAIILLHASNEKQVKSSRVDLVTWLGNNLNYIYGMPGIGRYVAASVLYAIEKILIEEKNEAIAIEQITFMIKLMMMKGTEK